jgi:hypothetical protein
MMSAFLIKEQSEGKAKCGREERKANVEDVEVIQDYGPTTNKRLQFQTASLCLFVKMSILQAKVRSKQTRPSHALS